MSGETVVAERRQNTKLRSIFDEACQLVAPFFDPGHAWGGAPLERLAYSMLRDRYPDLTPEEARILVIASARRQHAACRAGSPAARAMNV